MRKMLFFKTLLLITGGIVFAQNEYARPSHPLKPLIGQPRILADTLFIRHSWANDLYPAEPSSVAIERSKDGLRDTLFYADYVNRISVREYDADDRLISVRERIPPDNSFHVIEEYEYDASGRLTKLSEWSVPGVFKNYDYSTIVYTDSSHILNGIEYVFDSEDRLIRVGEVTYNYFEDGYEEILNSFDKLTYHFLENGYLSKRIFHRKLQADGQWLINETWETEYRYKDDNTNNPNSNIIIETAFPKVYGADGAAMIHSDKPEKVRIFSIAGTLVWNVQTASGSHSIPLLKGVYFVVFENKTYKVMVR
jgi:YD repeat-containing protein